MASEASGRRLPLPGRVAAVLALALLVPYAVAGGAAVVDPTRPPVRASGNGGGEPESGSAPGDLKLQTLLLGGERRLAIINGESVRVGDRIHGLTVQNILAKEVVLTKGGEATILRMAPGGGMEKVPSQ